MEKWIKNCLFLAGALWLLMIFTNTNVLFLEKKVDPGQKYLIEDYGDLGKSKQSSLVCRYFNGRKVLTDIYWYSSNNIMGKRNCPFLYKED